MHASWMVFPVASLSLFCLWVRCTIYYLKPIEQQLCGQPTNA